RLLQRDHGRGVQVSRRCFGSRRLCRRQNASSCDRRSKERRQCIQTHQPFGGRRLQLSPRRSKEIAKGHHRKVERLTMCKATLAALILLSILCHSSITPAQERARVGWAAMTASHTPLWVAQEKGFLAKQGLLVESIFFGAGPPAMQALVAGDLDIVVTSAPNVVNPRLGGADTVMILSIIPTFIDHIISAPSITSPEQLRGKIGSVNRFGSISEMGLRLSLRRLGIDPDKDVRIVPAGGNPE